MSAAHPQPGTRRPGASRRFTCSACGDVYVEAWTGSGDTDYRIDGPHGDMVPGCREEKRVAFGRGPHAFVIEVLSIGRAA